MIMGALLKFQFISEYVCIVPKDTDVMHFDRISKIAIETDHKLSIVLKSEYTRTFKEK